MPFVTVALCSLLLFFVVVAFFVASHVDPIKSLITSGAARNMRENVHRLTREPPDGTFKEAPFVADGIRWWRLYACPPDRARRRVHAGQPLVKSEMMSF